MCSVLTHPAIPLALSVCFPQAAVSPTLVFAGAVCSIIPDLDVIGFRFGISYGEMLGHRGFTHSIVFAAALSALLAFTLFRNSPGGNWVIFLFLFISTLSHSLLDMLTNGGLNRTPQHWYTQAASGIVFFCNRLTAAVTAFV
jgi:inner membrane protein